MNVTRFRRGRVRARRSWIAVCTVLLGCLVVGFFSLERFLRFVTVSTTTIQPSSPVMVPTSSSVPPSTETVSPGSARISEPKVIATVAAKPPRGTTLPNVTAFALRIESTGQYIAPLAFKSASASEQPRVAFVFSNPPSELTSGTRLSTTIQCLQTGTYLSRDVSRRIDDNTALPLLARVSLEKVQAKSAERWEIVGTQHRATSDHILSSELPRRFYLFGSKSSYLPDADRWCLADPRQVAEARDRGGITRLPSDRSILYLIDAATNVRGVASCAVLMAEQYRGDRRYNGDAGGLPLAFTGDAAASRPADPLSGGVSLSIVTTLKLASGDSSFALRHLAFWRDAVRMLIDDHRIPSHFHVCVDAEHDAAERVRRSLTMHRDDVHASTTQPLVTVHDDCEVHPVLRRPTYRGLFRLALEAAQKHAAGDVREADRVPLVLFVNADILMWPAQLSSVLHATSAMLHSKGYGADIEHVLVTGRRRNCPVDAFERVAGAVHDAKSRDTLCFGWWTAADDSPEKPRGTPTHAVDVNCPWYEDAAEDYFLLTPHALQWHATTLNGRADLSVPASSYATVQHVFDATRDSVPPMVVGGIAFDNWLVATMATLPRSAVVDATAALDVFHFGGVDDASLSASHRNEASKFNHEVAHYCGGWAHGKVSSHSFTFLPFIRGLRWASRKEADAEKERCDRVVLLHQRFAAHCASTNSEDCRLPFAATRPKGDAFDGPWVWSGG